nr:rep protein [Cressdnaviricota sp.]
MDDTKRRSRCWCFTLNNYTDKDIESLHTAIPDWVDYIIYGKEKGAQGTPHLQGYIEVSQPLGMKRLKLYLGDRVHLEVRRGSQAQAIKYCKKDGDIWEHGTPKAQGKRTDLDLTRSLVLQGKSMRELCMETSSYQTIRMAEKLLTYVEPSRRDPPEIIWIYGPSGYGKSHLAWEIAPHAYSLEDAKWWQGYDHHTEVILDNYVQTFAPIRFMLRMLDRYPMIVEYKGGSRQLLATHFIITSVDSPRDFFVSTKEYPEWMRRINQYALLINLDKPWQERNGDDVMALIDSKWKGKGPIDDEGASSFESESDLL